VVRAATFKPSRVYPPISDSVPRRAPERIPLSFFLSPCVPPISTSHPPAEVFQLDHPLAAASSVLLALLILVSRHSTCAPSPLFDEVPFLSSPFLKLSIGRVLFPFRGPGTIRGGAESLFRKRVPSTFRSRSLENVFQEAFFFFDSSYLLCVDV